MKIAQHAHSFIYNVLVIFLLNDFNPLSHAVDNPRIEFGRVASREADFFG